MTDKLYTQADMDAAAEGERAAIVAWLLSKSIKCQGAAALISRNAHRKQTDNG